MGKRESESSLAPNRQALQVREHLDKIQAGMKSNPAVLEG